MMTFFSILISLLIVNILLLLFSVNKLPKAKSTRRKYASEREVYRVEKENSEETAFPSVYKKAI
ncbi:hypothetical protein [Robertkochia aurantiaca]|uniref:hypothetical protein n=1 Tax=Robertkochia aurantiaca TaxID=2873700 RepID=UPI001CCFBFF9|nr:hypothetical protein [Robertkochia sp. 3YJGBD-33]